MSKTYPFRHLRLTLKLVRVQVQLLLGTEGLDWSKDDYATFLVMSQMTDAIKNPTHEKSLILVGAWLRVYKSLVERLPEAHEIRAKIQPEFDKICAGYEELT